MLALARLGLAVAYPLLAHWSSHGGDAPAAALALADLVLIVLLRPLASARGWAWALLAACLAALWAARHAPGLTALLLAPPVAFTAVMAWLFARSLRSPRGPLITRMAIALEYGRLEDMPARQQRYTRGLTAAWAALLALLATANTVLALIAVPGGVLARLGHAPLLAVSPQAWSWFANLLDYGVVGAFFAIEWLVRRRVFPDRRPQSPRTLAKRARALGPQFWAGLMR